ncbi:hypothetical protein MRB53_006115 [Persea americana]|uniref:Uncharacterized protein n=1 Tax=Persea americana TaxID=3435 RepID=A0ACC2MF20_PERAE|nr:hypothetical protein MRB53_006115 [Persea americana]
MGCLRCAKRGGIVLMGILAGHNGHARRLAEAEDREREMANQMDGLLRRPEAMHHSVSHVFLWGLCLELVLMSPLVETSGRMPKGVSRLFLIGPVLFCDSHTAGFS